METLKVIARSCRRGSNLLQPVENKYFHRMTLLSPDWIGGRNDPLWRPYLCEELLGCHTSEL
jgi:hypothetical protein